MRFWVRSGLAEVSWWNKALSSRGPAVLAPRLYAVIQIRVVSQ